jgi:hypothetical protein
LLLGHISKKLGMRSAYFFPIINNIDNIHSSANNII